MSKISREDVRLSLNFLKGMDKFDYDTERFKDSARTLLELAQSFLDGRLGELATEDEVVKAIYDYCNTHGYDLLPMEQRRMLGKVLVGNIAKKEDKSQQQKDQDRWFAKPPAEGCECGNTFYKKPDSEPNWEGKELDYNATLTHFAHQIDIPLWKAMSMMRYAKEKAQAEKGEGIATIIELGVIRDKDGNVIHVPSLTIADAILSKFGGQQ